MTGHIDKEGKVTDPPNPPFSVERLSRGSYLITLAPAPAAPRAPVLIVLDAEEGRSATALITFTNRAEIEVTTIANGSPENPVDRGFSFQVFETA